jgi:hypothetical protein
MHLFGRAALTDLLETCIAYRSLQPIDPRLPRWPGLADQFDVAPESVPRKGETIYGQVVAEILRQAQALRQPKVPLQRIVLLGDTQLGDLGAFTAICAATGWQGRALIVAEQATQPAQLHTDGLVSTANRWSLVHRFADELAADAFVNTATVVVLDIDKTLIGARGRNDAMIDAARLHALRSCLTTAIGPSFAEDLFQQTYQTLYQTRYHPFTSDNLDYIAALCLAVLANGITLPALLTQIDANPQLHATIVLQTLPCNDQWPAAAARLFQEIVAQIRVGDPTPFKAFRHAEFEATYARLAASTRVPTVPQLLHEQIVITAEVWQAAQAWKAAGALLFGLSDKPDEAALSTNPPQQESLHQIVGYIVGETADS